MAFQWTAFLPLPAGAQENEYTVVRIPVDITADNAAAARDRALLQAQREGLNRLAERFGVPAPQVSEARATDYVMSIEIDGEKSSAVRYIADVTVHYNPVSVNRLLNRSAAAFPGLRPPEGAPPAQAPETPPPETQLGEAPVAQLSEQVPPERTSPERTSPERTAPEPVPADAVLVLPVYEWAGSRTLWDQSNPWYLAWKNDGARIAGRPVALPQGEARDLEILTADQAVAGDRAAIDALTRHYGVSDVLVAYAVFEVDTRNGQPVFRVALNGYGNRYGGVALVGRTVGAPTEFVDELARRAVANVRADVERNWNRPGPATGTGGRGSSGAVGGGAGMAGVGAPMPLLPSGDSSGRASGSPGGPGPVQAEQSIVATVPLRGPADLSALRQEIGRLPMVVRDEIQSLSRERATIRLTYRGGPEALRNALAERGFRAEENGAGWTLRRSDAASLPAPLPAAAPSLR